MYAMGLKKSDLIPAKMAMTSAGGNSLEICGIAVWDISVRDEAGHMLSTKQLCYASTSVKRVLLSRQAMTDLHIISKEFPQLRTDGCLGVNMLGMLTL